MFDANKAEPTTNQSILRIAKNIQMYLIFSKKQQFDRYYNNKVYDNHKEINSAKHALTYLFSLF